MSSFRRRHFIVLSCLAGLFSGTLTQELSVVFPDLKPLPSASATRLSPELSRSALALFDDAKVRLDGSIQTHTGEIYLPLVPSTPPPKKTKSDVDATIPSAKAPDVVLYTDGWAHVRVLRKGEASTLALPAELTDKQRHRLLTSKFPSDLIVPDGFVVPRSLKALIQDVPTVSLVDDKVIAGAEFGQKHKAATIKEPYKGAGTVFLSSITAGSITMLDGKTLNKIAEFPTEGTPCSMELTGDKLYIADQAKSRVLILDPIKRKFAGQIDLPGKTGPKGIAALANGTWMYVSESAASDIAVIETATGKVLMKTKVHPGPGRCVLTNDGAFLLVLNVTSGEVTFLSTFNQKVTSILKVGDMPTAIVLSKDGARAYVSNRVSNTVSVIDLPHRQVVGTIKAGQSPTGLAVSPDDGKLYVASGRENSITVYDTKTLAKVSEAHLPSGVEFPGIICLLPGGHELLVSNQQSDVVAVLDTDKMEFSRQVALGHANHEVIWQPVP